MIPVNQQVNTWGLLEPTFLGTILKTLVIIVCWLTHKHLGPENDILRKSALESLQNKAIKRVTKVFPPVFSFWQTYSLTNFSPSFVNWLLVEIFSNSFKGQKIAKYHACFIMQKSICILKNMQHLFKLAYVLLQSTKRTCFQQMMNIFVLHYEKIIRFRP